MARTSRVPAALLHLMARDGRHAWTLENLRAGLARNGTRTDFSSVFRAAARLVTDGVLRKIVLNDGRARFERVDDHHDHLHCTRCDGLIPVPCAIPRAAFAALEACTGGTILEHHVVFTGVCRTCRSDHAPRRRRRRAR
jgi:Fur family transcriptional regulator, stress-responsive regulator